MNTFHGNITHEQFREAGGILVGIVDKAVQSLYNTIGITLHSNGIRAVGTNLNTCNG